MATDHLIGRTFGKYRVVEQIGRGGMAEVYKAYQPGLDRYVAIKVMHSFLSEDKDFLARFQREAKLVASMRHPNIVQVHDFDVESGLSYMVMEFIDGETLKARLQKLEAQNQWIPIDEAVQLTLAVGSALKYAHRLGMVHRDVKPANVMVDKHGGVILTDFGIAKIFAGGAQTQLTATGAMVGTPSYMSPEQGMGQPGDERSDIYSLGVMFYQFVTGRLPFEADTPLAVVIKHINDPLPMPRQANPEVPEPIERIILKTMAKNPDDRYQHVGDMLNDLKRATGIALDETPTDTMRARALPAGATAAGVGAVTPFPTAGRAAASTTGAPTAGSPAAKPTAATMVAMPKAGPNKVLIGAGIAAVALAVVIVIALIAVSSIQSAQRTSATQTAQALLANQLPTAAPTTPPQPSATSTASAVVGTIHSASGAKLRGAPGEASAEIGLLPQGTQLMIRQRTADNTWLRVEAPDGTAGWVAVKEIDLGKAALAEIPQSILQTVPTPTPNQAATVAACKMDAQITDVNVPDGSQYRPGEAFTKTWRLTNSGGCAWESGTRLAFQSGDKMDSPDTTPVDVVGIGKAVNVTVTLKAPATFGTFTGKWELRRPSGQVIASTGVSIAVPAPTPTQAPAPTQRPVAVATATPAAAATSAQPSGVIGPVGSGPLQAAWTPPFWNCVATERDLVDGGRDWYWEADFFIEVYGGTAGYFIVGNPPNCRWDYGQQKYVCRFGARFDGASVNQAVTVSCPNCKPVKVSVGAGAQRKGTSCAPQ